jgi:predicted lipoprotein with Yx(FWY)xxD motif
MLVDAQEMTLYTFDKDTQGKSNCNGGCATAWPPAPVVSDENAGGEFTIVTRDDGARQWAFKGLPLYRFAGDAKAGDANGDNRSNVWHVVRNGRSPQSSAGSATMGYGSRY